MLTFIKNNAFLALAIASVIFLLGYGLIRILSGAQGSWSDKLQTRDNIKRPSLEGASSQKDSEGERRTRAFLEHYFKKPFPKSRPNFLNNEVTGGKYNLEIDCFNEELKLGVEFNGRQHYEYVPFFHSSKEAFYNQKYRDKLKQVYCRDYNITLIQIPYTETKHLEEWLSTELTNKNYIPAP